MAYTLGEPEAATKKRAQYFEMFGHRGIWAVGFLVAGMTAFYMFRAVYMTFYQSEHMDEETKHHLHESPKSMTWPLWILAAGSIIVGWVGWPAGLGGSNHFHHWLSPVIPDGPFPAVLHNVNVERGLALVSVLWALVGIWLAARVYLRDSDLPARIASGWRRPILAARPTGSLPPAIRKFSFARCCGKHWRNFKIG